MKLIKKLKKYFSVREKYLNLVYIKFEEGDWQSFPEV